MDTVDPQGGAALIERLCRATNDHNLEAIVGCFAVEFRNETPTHPQRSFTGREQVRRNWAGSRRCPGRHRRGAALQCGRRHGLVGVGASRYPSGRLAPAHARRHDLRSGRRARGLGQVLLRTRRGRERRRRRRGAPSRRTDCLDLIPQVWAVGGAARGLCWVAEYVDLYEDAPGCSRWSSESRVLRSWAAHS